MHRPTRRPFGVFLLLLLLIACLPATSLLAQRRNTSKATPKPTPTPPRDALSADKLGAATPAPAFVLPDPAARVNGTPIAKADLEHVTDLLVSANGRALKDLTEADRKKAYWSVLDDMITDMLIGEKAAGETVSDMDVEKRFAELRAQYPDEASFDKEIKKSGQTPEQIRVNFRGKIARLQWVERQITDDVKVTPPEVEKFYKDGPPDKFDAPEMVKASHILIAVRRDAPPEDALGAEKKAADLAERIKKGEKFEDLAKQFSDDPATKQNGGDLDYFSRERIMPEFADAAFKLKVGDLSPPVRTQFGYHLIKVTDRKTAHTATFDEARDQIAAYLQDEKRRAAVAKLVQNLRDDAKIEIFLK